MARLSIVAAKFSVELPKLLLRRCLAPCRFHTAAAVNDRGGSNAAGGGFYAIDHICVWPASDFTVNSARKSYRTESGWRSPSARQPAMHNGKPAIAWGRLESSGK